MEQKSSKTALASLRPQGDGAAGLRFIMKSGELSIRESESEVAQLCPTLRNPMDYSLPGSSAHGIFQARVLEWGAMVLITLYPAFFLTQLTSSVSYIFSLMYVCAQLFQSCLTLCDPMDYSLPGSSAHGIFQARVLE